MAYQTALYLQARHIKTMKLQGGNPSSTGSITWSTAVDLSYAGSGGLVLFNALEVSSAPSLDMFRPSDLPFANYQNEFEDWTVTLRELMNPYGISQIGTLFATYDYARIDCTWSGRGGSDTGRIVVVGVRGDVSMGIQAGVNIASLTVRPAGTGIYISATPATTPPI